MSRVSATTQGDALSEISSDWVTDFGQTNIWKNIVELFSSLAVASVFFLTFVCLMLVHQLRGILCQICLEAKILILNRYLLETYLFPLATVFLWYQLFYWYSLVQSWRSSIEYALPEILWKWHANFEHMDVWLPLIYLTFSASLPRKLITSELGITSELRSTRDVLKL